ncbi:flagellar assembly protein FliW [Gemmatimonas aurantiaca]|uniref:flagellar assembly protein FliW n=1 Tax=Gemmatimonas aurantiaca TaxID=173480 RepID=UPI00301E38A8
MNESRGMVSITHHFGTIEVAEDAMMTFPTGGLFGFEKITRYALLPAARQGLWWLIAPNADATTFVLADPFMLDPDYAIDLGEREKNELQLATPSDALALVMLTLPDIPGVAPTANMRAPIVFNITRRLAAQVVSRDESHELQKLADLGRYPLQEGGVSLG